MKQLFKHYIKSDSIIFKYASGESEKIGKEFHSFNEIILFLEGDAELISENIHKKIAPNTIIAIPQETYHQVVIKGDKDNYRRCTLNFFDTPKLKPLIQQALNEITLISADTDFTYLFSKLIKFAENKNPNSQAALKSLLVLILCEISAKKDDVIKETSQNPLITSVILYINRNLSKSISIPLIAKSNNISESSLSHIFKKEMNIPIHQYIIKKRLIAAHHKINSGTPATTAAVECGFNDYSGFYKQYKKMFGFPPSKNTKTSD